MCGHVLRRHVSQKASDQVMGGLGAQHDLSHKLAGRRRVDTMTDSNLVR